MKHQGIKLRGGSPFHRDLRKRVDAHFAGRSTAGGAAMLRKTATLVAAFAVCYGLFLAFGASALAAALIAIPFGLVLGGFGFSVMHDGNHGAYSDDKRIDHAMGLVLDALGASSYLWKHKHNRIHHSHPNIVGADDDLEAGWFLRMAPGQPLHGIHRLQHLYMWPLYGFISIKWHWYDDFAQLRAGEINGVSFPAPKGRDRVEFIAGKLFFFTWALVLPIAAHGLVSGLLFYVVSQFVLGVALSTVFQLAHCLEEARFVVPPTEGQIEIDYATHQLETTVDFAPGNRLATWYLGGLNYQTVHHLFPRISHVHYPALASIVEETAADHGLTYRSHPTVRSALVSHYRWMKRMGHGEALDPSTLITLDTLAVAPEREPLRAAA